MEGGGVYFEGRRQRNGWEDEKSVIIVSYARYIVYIYEYRQAVWQAYYNSSSSNRQTTWCLERTAAVSSFLAVQTHVPGPLSSLLP